MFERVCTQSCGLGLLHVILQPFFRGCIEEREHAQAHRSSPGTQQRPIQDRNTGHTHTHIRRCNELDEHAGAQLAQGLGHPAANKTQGLRGAERKGSGEARAVQRTRHCGPLRVRDQLTDALAAEAVAAGERDGARHGSQADATRKKVLQLRGQPQHILIRAWRPCDSLC